MPFRSAVDHGSGGPRITGPIRNSTLPGLRTPLAGVGDSAQLRDQRGSSAGSKNYADVKERLSGKPATISMARKLARHCFRVLRAVHPTRSTRQPEHRGPG